MTDAPLAAIDAGSNTIHLTVARPTAGGADLEYLADELELVRLGADVSRTGAIGPERMARAVAVVRKQAEVARGHGAARILGIATEGVRTAGNGGELLERIRAETGVEFALVTGDQEAALTYWGLTSGLGDGGKRRAALDLGGGSLEVVVGEGTRVAWRVSVPLGSGVLHDRLAPSDPPRAAELAAVRREVAQTLAPLAIPLPVEAALAAGGTATTLAALAAQTLDGRAAPASASRTPENGQSAAQLAPFLTTEMLEQLIALLEGQSAADVTARYGIEEARARLLGAGATVLLATLERLGVPALHVRRRGIREGAILAYYHRGDGWLDAARDGLGW
jgi:exopolyphosphatase/pppGpp-phosphohydrolase